MADEGQREGSTSGFGPDPGAATERIQARPFAEMPVGAHTLGILRDGGQTFASMLEAIRYAERSICVETYILRDDRTGARFGQALAERARAGVEVNVLYDAWGSSLSPEFLLWLSQAGIRAVPFGHMGDGNIHFNLEQPITADPSWFLAQDHEIMDTVNEVVREYGGSFSAEHGIGRLKPYMMPDWRGGPELDLMRRIKAALDPAGILSPGRVIP